MAVKTEMKLLYTLKHVAYTAYSRYFCNATLVEGIMKDTGSNRAMPFYRQEGIVKIHDAENLFRDPDDCETVDALCPVDKKNHTDVFSWN